MHCCIFQRRTTLSMTRSGTKKVLSVSLACTYISTCCRMKLTVRIIIMRHIPAVNVECARGRLWPFEARWTARLSSPCLISTFQTIRHLSFLAYRINYYLQRTTLQTNHDRRLHNNRCTYMKLGTSSDLNHPPSLYIWLYTEPKLFTLHLKLNNKRCIFICNKLKFQQHRRDARLSRHAQVPSLLWQSHLYFLATRHPPQFAAMIYLGRIIYNFVIFLFIQVALIYTTCSNLLLCLMLLS